MFMGARGYLSRRYSYANGAVTAVPDHVISAYEKLITRGLFAPRGEELSPSPGGGGASEARSRDRRE
jgi:hypothetical protein